MREACSLVWSVLVLLFRSRVSLEAEILTMIAVQVMANDVAVDFGAGSR